MKTQNYLVILVIALALAATAGPLLGAAPLSEDKLLEIINSGASVGDKANACRELKLAGTEKSIPALAALLGDKELSDTARIALESMPYPAAGAALRDALQKASGLPHSGIVDSLGQRRDRTAIPLIAPDLASKDLVLVAAAATALGKIGDGEAAAALNAARAAAEGARRTKIDDGLLLCAGGLRLAGKNDEAAKIYTELSRPGEPRPIRAGAVHGRLLSAGAPTASAIAELLADQDAMVRTAAASEIHMLSDAELGALADQMAKLPETAQTSVLAAIRIHGKSALEPAVLAAINSRHEAVRLAAARALSTVGDVAALPALVGLSAVEGPVGETARQSLEAIHGPKIDEQIFAALRTEKDPLRRIEWIDVVQTRQPAGVVALLLDEAAHQDPRVAARALAALAKLAAPNNIPALVAIVLKTEKGPLRDEAEGTVSQICQQIADGAKRSQPVISIFQASTSTDRLALLPLLGRLGGVNVRPFVFAALDSKDPATYEAGVRAISNWPNPGVAEQLLRLTETADNSTHRQWALHAFVRVVSLPGGASNAEKLARLKRAMELSQTDEERLWVIQRAEAVRSVETLRFLMPYVDQSAFAERASASVVELAHHKELRDPNRKEFVAALKKVLATAKDAAVLENAKRYLEAQ